MTKDHPYILNMSRSSMSNGNDNTINRTFNMISSYF